MSNRIASHWVGQRIELHAWAPSPPSRWASHWVRLAAALRERLRPAPTERGVALSAHLRRDLGLPGGEARAHWTQGFELRRSRI